MVEISTRNWAIAMAGFSVILAALVFSIPVESIFKMVAVIIAALSAALSVAMWRYGYILIPYITRRANIIEIREGGHEITPAQDAVVKKVGDEYMASVFLQIKMYRSTTERTEEENVIYVDSFERAISQIKYPVKIGMILFAKEISKYREDIETKKYEAQLRLQRMREATEPDVIGMDRLEKEAAMWESQLTRISSGERPMGMVSYVMVTGNGVTKDAAVAVAKNRAAEVKTLFANALNVEVDYIYGEDMKRCFEMEYMIPPTTKALKEKFEE
jgi:hypothetical protein